MTCVSKLVEMHRKQKKSLILLERSSGLTVSNAVGLNVDNTNSMMGKNNSSSSQCTQRNRDIFVGGGPCHLVHIAASNGHDSLANIEDLHIDLYHSLEKSTKRKRLRLDLLEFCGHEYTKILKQGGCHSKGAFSKPWKVQWTQVILSKWRVRWPKIFKAARYIHKSYNRHCSAILPCINSTFQQLQQTVAVWGAYHSYGSWFYHTTGIVSGQQDH